MGKLTETPQAYKDEETGATAIVFEVEIEEFRRDTKGEKRRTATYLNFEAWDTAALAIEKFAAKGSLISIESSARNVENEDDPDFLDTYFRVNSFKILS